MLSENGIAISVDIHFFNALPVVFSFTLMACTKLIS